MLGCCIPPQAAALLLSHVTSTAHTSTLLVAASVDPPSSGESAAGDLVTLIHEQQAQGDIIRAAQVLKQPSVSRANCAWCGCKQPAIGQPMKGHTAGPQLLCQIPRRTDCGGVMQGPGVCKTWRVRDTLQAWRVRQQDWLLWCAVSGCVVRHGVGQTDDTSESKVVWPGDHVPGSQPDLPYARQTDAVSREPWTSVTERW
eukprot:jgi/Ulvmu1/10281/UM060_0083.1